MSGAPESAVTVTAPAKINLYLHVVGRRDDGMHSLDTLVVFTAFGDVVTVRPADTLSLQIDGPFADALDSEDKGNLVLQAASLLAAASGRTLHAAIHLNKHLPVAAGLGGGSADAAATLRALSRLWDITDGSVDLSALALRLGADVPMCLHGAPSFAGGIGEQLAPAPPLPGFGLLLVNPRTPLSTPAVFQGRSEDFSTPARFADAPTDVRNLATVLSARTNDLTAAATRCCPQVLQVLATLDSLPGCRLARLCGSGATCFGLFDNRQAAAAAAKALAGSPWWYVATETAARTH